MGRADSYLSREIRAYLGRISQAWNAFWFTPRDPFALCVMRCLVGWMAFYTTFVWGLELESFVFPHGYNSEEFVLEYVRRYEGPYAFSFWYYVPVDWIYPVHYMCLALTFCFMIGLFTRTTSILSLIIVISYAYRARFSNYGLDQILAILTLYLCVAPSGAYLSVDRLWKRYRSMADNLRNGRGAIPEAVQPTVVANIATRMIQYHYCVIYMAAGLGKLLGESWWDGSAMWRGLANSEYQTLDMTWLAYYPWFTEFLTHLTIAWEVSFAFLIWRPLTRPVMMALGLGMHFGIGLMMGMWTFATCMMFGYLAFVEPGLVRAFFHYLKTEWFSGPTQVLQVDPRNTAEVQQAAWRKAWDAKDRLRISTISQAAGNHAQVPSTKVSAQGHRHAPIVLLDLQPVSAKKTAETLLDQRRHVELVSSLGELQHYLDQEPKWIPVVNLDGLSPMDAQDYLHSYLPLHLQDRPSVTVLRGHHLRELVEPHRPDFQRFLLLPCDNQDIPREIHKAEQFFAHRCLEAGPAETQGAVGQIDNVLME